MAACDCIVTKAGPGTIAEALISGLPIVLSGFIPGQEEGNVPYVVDNGVGEYNADPDAIAAIVARWFGPEREKLRTMAAKGAQAGPSPGYVPNRKVDRSTTGAKRRNDREPKERKRRGALNYLAGCAR